MNPQNHKMPSDFVDRFRDQRAPGTIVGEANAEGIVRQGCDAENVIGIDNDALRIQPLVQPGWGRSGIAYGPYHRANGLAFAAFVLNGHNTSQVGNLTQTLVRRLGRWAKGSEAYGLSSRMLRWLATGDKRRLLREIRRWAWLSRQPPEGMGGLDQNMAIGWFGRAAPTDPLTEGNALVMHAAGPENGELWANAGTEALPALRGVQNLPIYYVIILRERGAAYYVASLDGARGFEAFPNMRPLAIDVRHEEDMVYAGLYQSVLGQIGFRVDTRAYAAQVAQVARLDKWYGTASAADTLTGEGPLDETKAETAGAWTVTSGRFERTPQGASPQDRDSLAMLDAGVPTGLLHTLIQSETADASASLVWRLENEQNFWCLDLSHSKYCLRLMLDGQWSDIATADGDTLRPGTEHAIQILDDGKTIGLYLDGRRLFDNAVVDERLADATGVGIRAGDLPSGKLLFSQFEAHPRSVPIPEELELPTPWQERGDRVAIDDDFAGAAGSLAGRKTRTGDVWRLETGQGAFDVSGDGHVRVRASTSHPNPGRTAYTVPWNTHAFADIEVTMTPPGQQRGEGENGRGGLIFWQDADNYIIINTWLDDIYEGASISSFFHLRGFEELYDAVWTNVGKRVSWGQPYRLRVVFDGVRYLTYLDGEPVLYRALTDVYPKLAPLQINRVGIVANWEWGNDTGTAFSDFLGRTKGVQQ